MFYAKKYKYNNFYVIRSARALESREELRIKSMFYLHIWEIWSKHFEKAYVF